MGLREFNIGKLSLHLIYPGEVSRRLSDLWMIIALWWNKTTNIHKFISCSPSYAPISSRSLPFPLIPSPLSPPPPSSHPLLTPSRCLQSSPALHPLLTTKKFSCNNCRDFKAELATQRNLTVPNVAWMAQRVLIYSLLAQLTLLFLLKRILYPFVLNLQLSLITLVFYLDLLLVPVDFFKHKPVSMKTIA